MADNLLNLVVKFTTLDGLSDNLKKMMGLGKSAKQALGDLQKEAKGLKNQMAEVAAEMTKSGSASATMMNRYNALDASLANVNRRLEQHKRLMAIDARTAKIQQRADAYKHEGLSGLMGAAMLAAPAMAIAHEAGEYQGLQNKLTMLGLGDKAVKDLTAYSKAMGIAGSSAKDNLRYLVEAQGAFRESGEHSEAEQLRGAKIMGPLMAKMAATLKASGHEMSEDQERSFLRFVEQAGGTTDPKRAAALTDGLFRAIQSSGGTVDASAYQGFLARAGTAGMKLSSRTMFADFEPLIAEMHDSAGVGLQGAYSRMNGMVKNQAAARELLRLGLWDKDKVIFNKVGGIKDFKNGANPLGAGAAAALSSDPVEFYRKYVLPAYQKRGVTDVERENMVLFGKSGGALFNLINKQLPTILRSRAAFEKTQSLDKAYNTTKDSFFGQGGQLKAAAQDFVIAAGSKGGLLENMTTLLKMATGALRGLTSAANAHPTVFRFLTTAVVALIGMRVATAGAKLAFGGLLGPVAQLWGLWSKYQVVGSVAALFPRIASGLMLLTGPLGWAIAGATALAGVAFLIYRNWGGITAFFQKHARGLRNLALGIGVIMFPLIAAFAIVLHRYWPQISAFFNWLGPMAWTAVKRLSAPFIWLGKQAVHFGEWLVMGLIHGIESLTGSVLKCVVGLAQKVGGAFAKEMGIHSPSRVMMAMGGHIATGLAIGVDQNGHHPVQSMRRMAATMVGASALVLSPSAMAKTHTMQSMNRAAAAAAKAGSVTMAPASGARPAPSDHGPAKIEIHIHQRPGEDAQALTKRVMEAIRREQRSSGLSSYRDDF